jgi:DNA-binding GntR family transcriptional regulator
MERLLSRVGLRTRNAKDFFEHNRQFWDTIFSKAQRPILWEVFRQLDDRVTRYDSFFLKVFPTPETRPRQREALIEIYRRGKIAEAFQAFKKNYLTVDDGLKDHLNSHEAARTDSLSSLKAGTPA